MKVVLAVASVTVICAIWIFWDMVELKWPPRRLRLPKDWRWRWAIFQPFVALITGLYAVGVLPFGAWAVCYILLCLADVWVFAVELVRRHG